MLSIDNAINGTPSCGNSRYQNGLLRDQWQWGGVGSGSPLSPFIVSDCHAIGDMTAQCNCSKGCTTPNHCTSSYTHQGHGYSASGPASVRDALRGGTDANCGCYFKKFLNESLAGGLINATDIDLAAGRLVNAMIRLGQLDEEGMASEYTQIDRSTVGSTAHRQLAVEAARQSITLLKNEPGRGKRKLLPLTPGATKLAFVGPHANATLAMLSDYHGDNRLVNSNSPLEAARSVPGLEVTYALGVNTTGSNDTSGIRAAVEVAKAADAVVVFAGMSPCEMGGCNEGEAHDRTWTPRVQTDDLGLPGSQQQLLEAVFDANPNTVLVLINGGALGIDWAKEHLPAIVEAFYPGELGGPAIVDVLTGKVEPTGKLPYTIYKANFGSQRAMTDMDLRSANADGSRGITHLHYTGTPLWAFGDGLGYAELELSWADDWTQQPSTADTAATAGGNDADADTKREKAAPTEMRVRVSNVGAEQWSSGATVLGFVSSDGDPRFPVQKLFGFGKAPPLGPGESAVVTLPLPTDEVLAVSDWTGRRVVSPGALSLRVGMQGQWLTHTRVLTGEAVVTEDYSALFER